MRNLSAWVGCDEPFFGVKFPDDLIPWLATAFIDRDLAISNPYGKMYIDGIPCFNAIYFLMFYVEQFF